MNNKELEEILKNWDQILKDLNQESSQSKRDQDLVESINQSIIKELINESIN